MAKVRPYAPGDIRDLAGRLRLADILELRAGTGHTPVEALNFSAQASELLWAIEDNGRCEGLFGLAYGAEDVGIPWLLASEELEKFARQFLRQSRHYVNEMQSRYPVLTNVVDARHVSAQRWLEWCGFKVLHYLPAFGREQLPFIQYIRVTDNV